MTFYLAKIFRKHRLQQQQQQQQQLEDFELRGGFYERRPQFAQAQPLSSLLNFHSGRFLYKIQWAPLNGITVNGIIRLLGSNQTIFSSTKTFWYLIYVPSSFGYWNHSVKGIILSLAQSYPIKGRLLYYKIQ
jgi:hypothetical protein